MAIHRVGDGTNIFWVRARFGGWQRRGSDRPGVFEVAGLVVVLPGRHHKDIEQAVEQRQR
ncbi:hypothetical protein HC891_00610 [Candidatus Gracilibacteria bacterium]|nr:hypothetical protein [Candidatus Gracilibacteria bacterium]